MTVQLTSACGASASAACGSVCVCLENSPSALQLKRSFKLNPVSLRDVNKMASIIAEHEPGSIPLTDTLVPASIFAPERGGCGDDNGDEGLEEADMLNGEPEDCRLDFTNKVKLGLKLNAAPMLMLVSSLAFK